MIWGAVEQSCGILCRPWNVDCGESREARQIEEKLNMGLSKADGNVSFKRKPGPPSHVYFLRWLGSCIGGAERDKSTLSIESKQTAHITPEMDPSCLMAR